MLLGNDVVLRDRSQDLARSVRKILQSPHDHLLGALRTLQNMVRIRVWSGMGVVRVRVQLGRRRVVGVVRMEG